MAITTKKMRNKIAVPPTKKALFESGRTFTFGLTFCYDNGMIYKRPETGQFVEYAEVTTVTDQGFYWKISAFAHSMTGFLSFEECYFKNPNIHP